ncbi:MAG: M14 family zinc carboxypeptidase [Bacteroidota bacterium]
MIKGLFSSLFLLISFSLFAQQIEQYSRAKVHLNGQSIRALAALGVEVDHGEWITKTTLISDFSTTEIVQIEDAGFIVEIMIEDVARFYVEQNLQEAIKSGSGEICPSDGMVFPTPENFELGSMGGYFTYDEMLAELDSMVMAYPNLITAKQSILGGLSIEGRPIYWVRLSDNPGTDESEPEVLYTALHHAREPAGLSQLIYYMWYLLENYGTDDFATYIVDNTELYFIPCINPDGYIYNEVNNPAGGGLWRKNRRDNGDGSFGVDLNRNYGYNWGLDNSGSSPFTGSNTYRGTAPFSEPELQLVRDFVEDREFLIALNYHTYGNYIIYPWGYEVQLTPDSTYFSEFSDIITRENNYNAGTAFETVGYFVNGNSDDWMYAEHDVLAMTPEAGPGQYGFWPPINEIDNICKASMWQNLTTAALLHNFGEATDLSPSNLEDYVANFDFSIKRYGMAPGQLTVSINPVSANIQSVSSPQVFTLDQFEESFSAFMYTLDPGINPGEEIIFDLIIDNDDYTIEKQITKTFGALIDLVSDDFDDLSDWTNGAGLGAWELTTDDFYSSPSSITDSPSGNYPPNIVKTIELTDPVDLVNAIDAKLNFWCRWDIEAGWDYVQVRASSDGSNFVPLCGKFTRLGAGPQDPGNPIYDSRQEEWVFEEMDLSNFIGGPLHIRFILVSDGGVEEDGFYFDDLSVSVVSELNTSVIPLEQMRLMQRVIPNPSNGKFVIELLSSEHSDAGILKIFGQGGQEIIVRNFEQNTRKMELDLSELPPGFYPYTLIFQSGSSLSGKAVILP